MSIGVSTDAKPEPPEVSEELTRRGFTILRGVFGADDIDRLREAGDTVIRKAGTTSVRDVTNRSSFIAAWLDAPRVKALVSRDLSPVRSILFDKTPTNNWPVAWHQDLTITVQEKRDIPGYGPWSVKEGVTHVQPPASLLEQMLTIRVHLDETPEGNGALRVIPGSHVSGRLSRADIQRHARTQVVTCECSPGDVLLMRPLLLHSSRRSNRPSRRRVIHIEFAPLDQLDPSLRWYESE